jgi:hypothetical protein
MKRYGRQVQPFLELLLQKPVDALSLDEGDYFERALVRGTLPHWLKIVKSD